MKVLKSLLIAAVLIFGATSAMAQATYTDKNGDEYEFKGHWFLQLQGGSQYDLDDDADFWHSFKANIQVGLGYQFTPVFGARLQVNAWKSKYGWDTEDDYLFVNHYNFNYVAPGIDFMFNLSNAICGWNPKRFFNVTAFVGAGANIAWDNDLANEIASVDLDVDGYTDAQASLGNLWDGTKARLFGRAGLAFDFRVCDALSIGLEANANATGDGYDSKDDGGLDWYFNGLVGVKINLGKTYTKKEKPAPAPAPPAPVERKAEPAPAPAPEPVPEPEPEPVKVKAEPIERVIFFTINTTTITASEQVKIDEVVKYLNENPEAKVTVTGYADSGTGNEEINNKLAAKRANTTVNALKAAGIDASRISSSSKGDKEQPFAENDKNRCAIVIAAE